MLRADKLLVDRLLVTSRTQAQRLINEGKVRYQHGNEWLVVRKSSDTLPADAALDIVFDANDRFVSRGGLKLAHALDAVQIDVQGKTALDVGQSTGGFTDCLLQAGCAQVVGIDVGHDQLDARLRADARVVCLEGINARSIDAQLLLGCNGGKPFDIIVMDVSFISQTLILPQLAQLLAPQGVLVSLVKPQFELTREQLGKGGIVRDVSLYADVKARIEDCLHKSHFMLDRWLDSPIEGGDGNREFLVLAHH